MPCRPGAVAHGVEGRVEAVAGPRGVDGKAEPALLVLTVEVAHGDPEEREASLRDDRPGLVQQRPDTVAFRPIGAMATEDEAGWIDANPAAEGHAGGCGRPCGRRRQTERILIMDWSFWDVLWTTFVVFLWISVLMIYFQVVVDVFRSHDLSGWGKTGWLIVLVVLPLIGLLIYTVARGPGMSERAVRDHLDRADQIRAAQGDTGGGDPTGQIARAKELLDGGVIDEQEFEQLKRRALAA